MTKVKVLLDSIDKVKNFVNTLIKFDCDFDISSSRYTIDAKSIMGIFSLDLSQPLDMIIHRDGDVSDIMEAIAPYIVESDSDTYLLSVSDGKGHSRQR